MVKVAIDEILSQKKKSRYWFIKEMKGSYQSLTRLLNNKSSGLKFETLEKVCEILECNPGDLIKIKK